MPPRYAYWTILADGLPTAFRAGDREELLPTFNRIRAKHPDAEMKYFARGKLWASPEDVQREAAESEARGADWRPGGTHRDPRQPYEDARKARNLQRRKRRFEHKHAAPTGETPVAGKPHGDPLRPKVGRRPAGAFPSKPLGAKPFGAKPFGSKPFGAKPLGSKPFGAKPPGAKPFPSKPAGSRPFGSKPTGPKRNESRPPDSKPFGPKRFASKSPGSKPFGARPHGRSGPGGSTKRSGIGAGRPPRPNGPRRRS